MNDTPPNPITRKIEDGSYFTAARKWYSDIFHSPIAERTYYVITMVLSLLCLYFSYAALSRLYPISPRVPFVIYGNNIIENAAHIRKLAENPQQNKNEAVMKFMIDDYVTNREAYDSSLYEFRYRNIWSHSAPQVFNEYKWEIDATNPISPYHQYTDAERRAITIDSIAYDRSTDPSHATVVFEASVISNNTRRELQHSKWQADLTYRYTDFKIPDKSDGKKPAPSFFGLTEDQTKGSGETKEIVPMTFIVSDYKVKELLE